jgi:PAS domain S-box-containing protein
MQFQYSPYIIPLFMATALSGGVAFYTFRRRSNNPSAISLSFLSLAIVIWSFGYALEIAGADLPTKILSAKFEYLGGTTVPLLWMVFAFNHANQINRLKYKTLIQLSIVPIITILLVFTTELHGLVWNKMYIQQENGFAVLGVSHGFWFWVHFAYSYLMLFVGSVIVFRSIWRMQGLYRRQAAILIAALLVPWLSNILFTTGLSPIPNLDLTPFAFTISVMGLTWGIFGFQLVDLSPLARDIVVDEMKDGMVVIDLRGYIVDINPAAQRLIGLSGAQAIGRAAQEVFSRWPHFVERYGDVSEVREEIVVGEGEEQNWYELHLSSLNDRQKHFRGRVITIHNITDSKRAEKHQEAFLDDMRALQQIHLVLSEISDLEMLYIKMIELAQQRLGIDRVGLFLVDEVTNRILGTYGVDPDGNIRDESYYHEIITPDHWTLEILHAPSGLKFWKDAPLIDNGEQVGRGWKVATTLWNGQKAIGYMVCDNFHSRKNARPYESELISVLGNIFGHLIENKQVNERIRQIVENASDLIYRTDANGHFTYLNPTALHVMGYATDTDMLGKHFLDMVSPNWHSKLQRFYNRQFLRQEPNTYHEFPVLNANGQEIWLGQNVQIVKDGKQIVGFQAVARDITELKQTQDALALARDQALEASRAKSQLLAKVSHELRTPLGGIMGYAELLHYDAFGALNEEQKQAAAQIIDSANYLNTIVNELLDEAQIETKAMILHMDRFSPAVILNQVNTAMAVLAHNKDLKFTASVSPDLPGELVGDSRRLQQILINLAGNAIKFTQTGEVCMNFYQPNSHQWAMQVTDTGVGIPKDAQLYIFEPFRQLDNSITHKNRGTGLGLSIAKQLVELMGGQITVESEVGQGSTFTVFLPIMQNLEKKI